MRRTWLLPAVIVVLSACASRSALVRSLPPGPAEVRIPIAPDQADAVFARAVEVLEDRGFRLVECDDGRSVLRTDRTEVDAPCFETSCLSRQRVELKVGWRRLALTLRREYWDAACRTWIEAADPASRTDVERELRALVRDVVDADLGGLARSRLAHSRDAVCQAAAGCGPQGCDPGAAREAEPVFRGGVPVATR